MTDKIKKFLSKLPVKDLRQLLELQRQIMDGNLSGLNIVQLKGLSNTYRARKGRYRIIFTVDDGEVKILSIARRSEKTYKNL